jgi:tRNA G10  N-methylase Trm11
MRWDARRLPLARGAIDKVVTNLPFGRQILDQSQITALYVDFFAEARRVLAPDGLIVALTDQEQALLRAVERARMAARPLAAVSLKGLHPQIWKVTAAP